MGQQVNERCADPDVLGPCAWRVACQSAAAGLGGVDTKIRLLVSRIGPRGADAGSQQELRAQRNAPTCTDIDHQPLAIVAAAVAERRIEPHPAPWADIEESAHRRPGFDIAQPLQGRATVFAAAEVRREAQAVGHVAPGGRVVAQAVHGACKEAVAPLVLDAGQQAGARFIRPRVLAAGHQGNGDRATLCHVRWKHTTVKVRLRVREAGPRESGGEGDRGDDFLHGGYFEGDGLAQANTLPLWAVPYPCLAKG